MQTACTHRNMSSGNVSWNTWSRASYRLVCKVGFFFCFYLLIYVSFKVSYWKNTIIRGQKSPEWGTKKENIDARPTASEHTVQKNSKREA